MKQIVMPLDASINLLKVGSVTVKPEKRSPGDAPGDPRLKAATVA